MSKKIFIKQETAILIAISNQKQSEERVSEFLDELEFLALTAGAKVMKRFVQNVEKPDSRTYVGKGKLAAIKTYIKANDIQIAIFDDDLSPSQVKVIEKVLECKILDRSLMILDIFAMRAKTAQARLQVELAQYQYLLPRLTNMWTHLSKQKGGIGMKGPGETEIETDRRVIKDKISKLKKQLEKIDLQNTTRRKSRQNIRRVSLVGYTNTGKSTLMSILSKQDVFAENRLFATLDSLVRKVVINNIPFLLSDTVGFIRKLPHHLIESFKSTLDEIRESDIIIHVIDISHKQYADHVGVVNEMLVELDSIDKPIIHVFNKIDQYINPTEQELEEAELREDPIKPRTLMMLENSWIAKSKGQTVFISALKKQNLNKLKEMIGANLELLSNAKYYS